MDKYIDSFISNRHVSLIYRDCSTEISADKYIVFQYKEEKEYHDSYIYTLTY